MSELTKLINRIDVLSKGVETINVKSVGLHSETDQSVIQASVVALTKFSSELSELSGLVAKFEAKLKAVDPITGEKRFGAATESKILALSPVLNNLSTEIPRLLSLFAPLLITEESTAPIVESAVAVEINNEEESARIAELEKQRLEQEAAEAELNKKAQLIRDRKALEMQQLELYNRKIEDKLIAVQTFANQASLDSAAVLFYIQSFVSTHLEQKKTIIEMLKTASSILEAIISRPDNIALRKLRLTHPALKTKLIEVQSGIDLLLSLGFRMVLVTVASSGNSQPSSSSAPSSNPSIDKILQYSSSECPMEQYRDILHLLTPNTKWDCVMEMEEPSVSVSATSVAGKDDWIVWFDKLSADRDLLTSTLKTVVSL